MKRLSLFFAFLGDILLYKWLICRLLKGEKRLFGTFLHVSIVTFLSLDFPFVYTAIAGGVDGVAPNAFLLIIN